MKYFILSSYVITFGIKTMIMAYDNSFVHWHTDNEINDMYQLKKKYSKIDSIVAEKKKAKEEEIQKNKTEHNNTNIMIGYAIKAIKTEETDIKHQILQQVLTRDKNIPPEHINLAKDIATKIERRPHLIDHEGNLINADNIFNVRWQKISKNFLDFQLYKHYKNKYGLSRHVVRTFRSFQNNETFIMMYNFLNFINFIQSIENSFATREILTIQLLLNYVFLVGMLVYTITDVLILGSIVIPILALVIMIEWISVNKFINKHFSNNILNFSAIIVYKCARKFIISLFLINNIIQFSMTILCMIMPRFIHLINYVGFIVFVCLIIINLILMNSLMCLDYYFNNTGNANDRKTQKIKMILNAIYNYQNNPAKFLKFLRIFELYLPTQ